MKTPIEQVCEALEKMNALVERMQNVMADHLPPDGTSEQATISELIELLDGPDQRAAQEQVRTALTALRSEVHEISVDELANEIRRVDGSNSLGAGALAEALIPFLTEAAKP